MEKFHWSSKSLKFISLLVIVSFILTGCNLGDITSLFSTVETISLEPIPQAEIVFQVQIPDPSGSTPRIGLEILDEVTGLALNPTRYEMETIDPTHYYVRITAGINTVVRYRFIRLSDPVAIEYNAIGQQVRYRMLVISGPAVIQDIVAGWQDQLYQAGHGRISGRIINASNTPLPGIMVLAGGLQTFTASDGSFLLEGLPTGNQNLVAYSTDGSYLPFQQGAIISDQATTPALFEMEPSGLVSVTFMVASPPLDNGAMLRLVGNIIQTGNTFSDLQGGMSIVSTLAPVLSLSADGRYSVTLRLPAGLYLQYKYTLGDGFWNAEHGVDGRFILREFIVPDHDVIIEDTVETWSMLGTQPVTIEVTVPSTTPITDTISIQFNPYGWTVPLPMWLHGQNQYYYVLYSPLGILGNVGYRFCRNEQCGTADDASSIGDTSPYSFAPASLSQVFTHQVNAWAGMTEEVSIPSSPGLTNRPASFVAGIGIASDYSPTWLYHLPQGFRDIHDIGANCVVLRPSWTYTQVNPPVLEPVAGENPSWFEFLDMAADAQEAGLAVILYPEQIFPYDAEIWWQNASLGEDWYSRWFERYYAQMITAADQATAIGAAAVILGGPGVEAALPNGLLPDGTPANVPDVMETRWLQLIQDMRAHYQGALIWAFSSPSEIDNPPNWLGSLDAIMVELEINPAGGNQISVDSLVQQLQSFYQGEVLPVQQIANRAVLLAVRAPSPSLQQQADVLEAVLQSIQTFPWITGFINMGFNPSVAVMDGSASIHGKPAALVINTWFHLYASPQ